MTLARCEHCGAPLELAAGAASVRCSYCQHDQLVAGLVTAVEGPVAASTQQRGRHAVGEAVLCEWRGRWWPASILEVLPGERYRIHYDGYSSSWDEVVGPERLAARSQHASPTFPRSHAAVGAGSGRGVVILVAIILVVVAGVGAMVALLGLRSTAPAAPAPPAASSAVAPGQLTVGQPVSVLWGERWWNATVLRVRPDGRVRIHYDGWADSWDEDVTLDRVRLR